jgi:hypothetical protein
LCNFLLKDNEELLEFSTFSYLKDFVENTNQHNEKQLWVKWENNYISYLELKNNKRIEEQADEL